MGKTFKDRKDYPKYRKAKAASFSKNYIQFRQDGPYDPIDDGDMCPVCGASTEFELGYLSCRRCGWDNSGVADVCDQFLKAS